MHIHLRYPHKNDNGVANTAGDVLCRLRRIVHSLKVSGVQISVKDFKKWEMYKGKLKNRFKGNTYFKIHTKIR